MNNLRYENPTDTAGDPNRFSLIKSSVNLKIIILLYASSQPK